MGIITNLIQQNHMQKAQQHAEELQNWTNILSLENTSPELKTWAAKNLAGVAEEGLGVKGKEKGMLHGLISSMAGLNPLPGRSPAPAGPMPQRTMLSEEEVQQRRNQQAAQQTQLETQKKEAERKALLTQRFNEAADLGLEGPDAQEYVATGALRKDYGKPIAPPKVTAKTTTVQVQDEQGNLVQAPAIERVDAQGNVSFVTPDGLPLKPASIKGYGEIKPARIPTENEMALDAYAKELGTTADKLTATQRVKAIKRFKQATSIRATGEEASKTLTSIASQSGYVKGGKSIANPNGNMGIDLMAWDYLTTGNIHGAGRGKEGEARMRVATARAGEIIVNLGIDPSEVTLMRAGQKVNQSALAKVTVMGSLMSQFENTAENNIKYAKVLIDRYSRSGNTLVNRIKGGIDVMTGDKDVNNFLIQMRTLATEYAKIMSGSVSASGSRVSDVEEATRMINGYLSRGQLDGLFDLMQVDFANRQKAVDDEKNKLMDAIRNPASVFGKTVIAGTPKPVEAPNGTPKPSPQSTATASKSKPWIQHNSKTGKDRYSLDGGKTWTLGLPATK